MNLQMLSAPKSKPRLNALLLLGWVSTLFNFCLKAVPAVKQISKLFKITKTLKCVVGNISAFTLN